MFNPCKHIVEIVYWIQMRFIQLSEFESVFNKTTKYTYETICAKNNEYEIN